MTVPSLGIEPSSYAPRLYTDLQRVRGRQGTHMRTHPHTHTSMHAYVQAQPLMAVSLTVGAM